MNQQIPYVALIQASCGSSKEKNVEHVFRMVREAARNGANIIALPELFSSHYFCQLKNNASAFENAESIPGPTFSSMKELAKELKIVLIGGSIFEKAEDGKYYNTSVIFDSNGDVLSTYRKTHIPEDPFYHEKNYFSEGNTGVQIANTKYGKIASLICYDQWYPEMARIAALSGAKMIFYPSAIGTIKEDNLELDENWQEMWINTHLGHASSNNIFIAAINRVGEEDNINFWGTSFIANPASEIIAKGEEKDTIIYAACDLEYSTKMQDAWRFIPNRRPNTYGQLIN